MGERNSHEMSATARLLRVSGGTGPGGLPFTGCVVAGGTVHGLVNAAVTLNGPAVTQWITWGRW